MSYPVYAEYSVSGAALGTSYPKSWPIQRLRFSILSNPVRSEVAHWEDDKLVSFVPMEAVGEQGGMDASQERPIGDVYTGYTYFSEKDILIAKITPCFENGKGAIAQGLKNGVGFGTTEFHVLRPLENISAKWLFYLTMSDAFRKIGSSEMLGAGGQKRVQEDFIKDFRTGIPSLSEQQQIAAFLDWKTGQIDALIAKKKALMDKLKEKRLAVITQAVTKGLNPAAPLRDSGIPWLGTVPAHWEVRKLKYCFDSLNNRRIPLSSEERANMPRDYPYYGASGIIDYVEDYIFDESLILIAEDGANLLSRSTPLAFEAHGKYWVNNHAHILKPGLGPFTYWSNLLCIVQYEPWITGAAQPKLTKENLGVISLPFPPSEEQEEICVFINIELERIDPLINVTAQTIARLTEYRTALITAATTGKIDVRHVPIPAHS